MSETTSKKRENAAIKVTTVRILDFRSLELIRSFEFDSRRIIRDMYDTVSQVDRPNDGASNETRPTFLLTHKVDGIQNVIIDPESTVPLYSIFHSDNNDVLLHPGFFFKDPNDMMIKLDIVSLLKTPLPFMSGRVNPKFAASTRAPSSKEMSGDGKLRGIIWSDEMLVDACRWAEGEASKPEVSLSQYNLGVVHGSLHPSYTSLFAPPRIASEDDSRLWISMTQLRPALAMAYLSLQSVHSTDSPSLPFGKNPSTLEIGVTAALGTHPVPDHIYRRWGMPWSGNVDDNKNESRNGVILTFEYKTNNALPVADLRFLPTFKLPDTERIDKVIPFVHPGSVGCEHYTVSKDTKILNQVYFQMFTYNVNYAILSSYDHTLFVRRETYDGRDILRLSSLISYDSTTTPVLLSLYAWIMMSENDLDKPGNTGVINYPAPDFSACEAYEQRCEISNPLHVGLQLSWFREFSTLFSSAQDTSDQATPRASRRTRRVVEPPTTPTVRGDKRQRGVPARLPSQPFRRTKVKADA